MLTESDLQAPAWLAAIASGQCVVIRGHIGEHRLEGLKGILPLGVFQWVPIELPQGEALDPEFFVSIMPALLGEVPRKIYILPLVASTVQIDALAEVRANQPWIQWVAVVPDPEIDPVLPDGVLLFDAKARSFADEYKIPVALKTWATNLLGGARSEEERKRVVGAEGPKILATINAIAAGEYQSLPNILEKTDTFYLTQLVTIAAEVAGVEGIHPESIAAEIEEAANLQDTINKHQAVDSPVVPGESTQKQNPAGNLQSFAPRPQIFEDGKALPMYAPGDPASKYAREMDALRRDREALESLLEILQELECAGSDDQGKHCAGGCTDPTQKWACLRDNTWHNGMPAAIVDHWLEIFAFHVARVRRNPREAFNSFTNAMLQASAANPTFSEVDFKIMVQRNRPAPPEVSATPSPRVPQEPPAMKALPFFPPNKSSPSAIFQPLKNFDSKRGESRAQQLCARLDALATRIEKIRERYSSNLPQTTRPHTADDSLPHAPAADRWEADDDGDLSLESLEKRVSRLA